MKTVKVVAAIICDNIKEKNKIFATARGYGELKGGWEFPGGKVEPGETSQQALVREIMEELDTEITALGGYYDFGVAKLNLGYVNGKATVTNLAAATIIFSAFSA